MATMKESGRPCKIFLLGSWFCPLDDMVNIDKELSIMGLILSLEDKVGLVSVDDEPTMKLLCPFKWTGGVNKDAGGATCCFWFNGLS